MCLQYCHEKNFKSKLITEFLKHETMGGLRLENVIKKRFDGEKSIWHPITSNVKAATVKIKDQLVQVKEKQTNITIPYCM